MSWVEFYHFFQNRFWLGQQINKEEILTFSLKNRLYFKQKKVAEDAY